MVEHEIMPPSRQLVVNVIKRSHVPLQIRFFTLQRQWYSHTPGQLLCLDGLYILVHQSMSDKPGSRCAQMETPTLP